MRMKIKTFAYVFVSVLVVTGVININTSSAAFPMAKAETIYGPERRDAAAAMQKGKITNPSVAAQRLYKAWKQKSKKSALKVAAPAAVSKLFGTKWRSMKFKGCQNTGGSFECIYHDPKLDLDISMIVEGGASAGYHVESVSFSTEAASMPTTPFLNSPSVSISRISYHVENYRNRF